MAALLKDLFSLLKALLTLLFVVFLAVTRPGPIESSIENIDSDLLDAGSLSIDRLVTMSFELPCVPPSENWINDPEEGIPTFSRIAVHPSVNANQPDAPSEWVFDANSTAAKPLTVQFDGDLATWSIGIQPTKQPNCRRFDVQMQFEESTLNVFPMELEVLLEIELPQTPPWMTSSAFECWQSLAAVCDQLGPQFDVALIDPQRKPFYSECIASVSETDIDFTIWSPAIVFVSPSHSPFICVPLPTSDTTVSDAFISRARTNFGLEPIEAPNLPQHLHYQLTPPDSSNAPSSKQSVYLIYKLKLYLDTDSEAGAHPPIRYAAYFAPTQKKPTKPLLNP